MVSYSLLKEPALASKKHTVQGFGASWHTAIT
jgi:hypothetical protein